MNITIGDTPEQLGSCLTADAVMIDGSVITKQQIAELMAQNAELVTELASLAAFRDEVVGVMNNSQGVWGWHHNHTVATWDELFPVVPDFESPAQCLRDIQAEAGRAGFVAGAVCARHPLKPSAVEIKESADQYAEKVRSGEA